MEEEKGEKREEDEEKEEERDEMEEEEIAYRHGKRGRMRRKRTGCY